MHASRRREASQSPMLADDLIQLDNEKDQIDQERLEELSRTRLSFSSTARRKHLELEPRRLGDERSWEVELDDDLVIGRVGGEVEAIAPPAREAPAEAEFDPHLPKGGGVTYHPKLGTAEVHEPLRRRNGARVIPHGHIFGADDRQVFVPSGYPWRCIGKVLAWTDPSSGPAWSGTGALVGRNVVLTVSHVVPWPSNPWMMQFVPAYWDGASWVGRGISSFVQSVRGYRDHGQGDDMAVLKLYANLGDTLGYFGYKSYDDDWEGGNYWTKVGYPGMIAGGQRPSRVTWYPIIDDDSDGAGVELEYRADASGGDSGGPVFGWWPAGPYVVGTHSGGEEEYEFPWYIVKNNVAAGGSALSSLIGWARSNW